MILLESLLFAGFVVLLGISYILLRNRIQFRSIAETTRAADAELSVAVCIPARNEEKTIRVCLDHLLSQTYQNMRIYVLNDRSTDRTGAILEQYQNLHGEKLEVLQGGPRPDGWLGKPYACHQLGEHAKEDILIFADADTWMHPDLVRRVMGSFNRNNIDFITVWPEQKLKSFWEKIVVPLVYYALLGLLPVAYTERNPRWMPSFFHNRFRNLFAAACGQFMAFRRETYNQIGGHAAVKEEIVEDVMLAREILDHGFRMRMYHGVGALFCRMYTSQEEMFQGFRKNFLAGFNYSIPLFVFMAVVHLVSFILPVLTLAAALFFELSETAVKLSAVMITVFVLHRVILGLWMKWGISYALLHPLGVLWFQRLGIVTLLDYVKGRSVNWKGDAIRHPETGRDTP